MQTEYIEKRSPHYGKTIGAFCKVCTVVGLLTRQIILKQGNTVTIKGAITKKLSDSRSSILIISQYQGVLVLLVEICLGVISKFLIKENLVDIPDYIFGTTLTN